MIYEFHNPFERDPFEEYRMTPSFGYWLLMYAAVAIIALIVLIARYRLNPFIVITLISIGLALVAPIVVQDELTSGRLVEAKEHPKIKETFYAITLRRRFPNPIVQELLASSFDPAPMS